MVDQEIRALKAGRRGEHDTAYEIDFHLGESKNTMVLHDLRFELDDGRVAQIDHLLIQNEPYMGSGKQTGFTRGQDHRGR